MPRVLGNIQSDLLPALRDTLISRYNSVVFHGLDELLAVPVAWAVCLLAWNSRRFVAAKSRHRRREQPAYGP